MRPNSMRLTALVLVLTAVLQALGQTPQPKAHIEGIVLDGLTGQPVADAIVSATGQTANDLKSDAQGRFAVEVNSGPAMLSVSKVGYRPARLEGRKLPNNAGIPIQLEPGQRQSGLVVRLFPQPVVTGKVFDQRGQPMQDAEIQVFAYIYNEAGVRMRSNAPGGTRTNDLGDFRIESLDPGEYFMEIRPASPDLGGTSGSVLAPIFYPGTTDMSRAEPIVLQPGARVQLRNITAIPVRGGSLRVKLANQGDEPRGASILSVFREGETASAVRTQMVQKDVITETVDLGRLAPGKYFVRAGFAGVNNLGTNEGRTTIDVTESDTLINLPIVTFKTWTFAGRAVVEGANGQARPVPGIQLAFYDVGPNAGNQFLRFMAPVTLTSQPDGSFPGRNLVPSMPPYAFHVRVLNPPPGMYVSTIRGGSSTRELRADYGNTTNLTVVFGENAGTIEGTLTDLKGSVVQVGNVVLIPDNPNEIHRLVTANTATNGTFRLQAGPGAYRLYAWRELLGAPYMNAEYMQKHRDNGLPVRVELGGRSTVNVKVLED